MGASTVFDTLQYAKKLKEAGVSEKQAEVQAEALAEVFTDRLATKEDINLLRRETKEDINLLRRETKEDINLLRKDMETMRMEFRGDINVIKWMMGFLLALNAGIVLKLLIH